MDLTPDNLKFVNEIHDYTQFVIRIKFTLKRGL